VECLDCGTELEVVDINPFKVQEAPQAEEDWGE
jgi:alpha-aminoadipate carrier protein LysW